MVLQGRNALKSDTPDRGSTGEEKGRLLAVDYGSVRVGLAMSDPFRIIAQGAGTLMNDGNLLPSLAQLVVENDIREIVVGMPYAPDGGKGSKAKEVDTFIIALSALVSVRVEPWDESFTSLNAKRVFIKGGMKRKQRQQKGRVDEMAARLLLQDYLDCHQGG